MADIKEIIDKLQKIDIKDIKAAIDMQAVQDTLLKRKDLVIDVFLIIVTLFVINFIFSSRQKTSQEMTLKIKNLEKKSVTIQVYENRTKKLDKLIDSAAKGFSSPTTIINAISEITQKLNIKISSFNPDKLENLDEYTKQTVKFNFSGTFQNMLQLIYQIENYKRNLRIDSWSREKGNPGLLKVNDEDLVNSIISWKMSITSIELKK